MGKKVLIFVLFSAFLVSCVKPIEIKQLLTFDNAYWQGMDRKDISINIEDIEIAYKLSLTLKYNDDFKQQSLPLQIIITSPEGETSMQRVFFQTQDKFGNYAGEFVDGSYILENVFFAKRKFTSAGNYSFNIRNGSDKYDNYGLESLELKLIEVK